MHFAVAHGRKRFDAEEERPRKSRRAQIRHRARRQVVQAPEQEIENEKECRNGGEQLRPGHGHQVVVQILEHGRGNAAGDDLSPADLHSRSTLAHWRLSHFPMTYGLYTRYALDYLEKTPVL